WGRVVDVFSGWTKAPAAAAHPRFPSPAESPA
ncbi:alpha/beta hydrolase, partial [Klebsiella pneumoniae]